MCLTLSCFSYSAGSWSIKVFVSYSSVFHHPFKNLLLYCQSFTKILDKASFAEKHLCPRAGEALSSVLAEASSCATEWPKSGVVTSISFVPSCEWSPLIAALMAKGGFQSELMERPSNRRWEQVGWRTTRCRYTGQEKKSFFFSFNWSPAK